MSLLELGATLRANLTTEEELTRLKTVTKALVSALTANGVVVRASGQAKIDLEAALMAALLIT